MTGGWQWDVAAVITVVGWLLSPIITLLLPKIFSCLGFDASQKLRELEIHIIPELQQTMHAVDQERMMERGEKSNSDVAALKKMAAMLRHARDEADDIFDDAQDKIVSRCWHHLYHVVATCIARCKSSCAWIVRIVQRKSARILQWAPKISLCRSEDVFPMTISVVATCIARFKTSCAWIAHIVRSGSARLQQCARKISLRGSEDVLPMTASAAPSNEPAPVVTSVVASNGLVPVATNAAHSDSSWIWLSCWCSLFDFFKNYCRSIFYWLVHAIEFARFYRDWSYDVVGITSYQENATALDFVLTAILKRKLKKRIEKVESIISEVKKSPLLGVASSNAPNDIANKNRSRIRAASKRKVFGREVLRDDIMARLRETPQGDAPSSSPCYSVIGIYGVAGSGKTTFAGYIRDYIKEECKEKLFDAIMCIHVSETFSVDDIFHEMLKDITKDRHSNISDREELEEKLKEALRGKRFFLILDDLWVKNKNDLQLEELISPLNVGVEGSKVLVTARTKVAARALCVDEPIEMPNLDEDHYMSMFMHYALGGASDAHEEFIRVGREIAEKLHRSPIAAVTVAGQIGTKRDIKFWKSIANLDMLNDTMDALWWSYEQLNPDIRRCFEFCNIFPRRSKLRRDKLVRLWMAQGFLKASCATEDMEDVAEGYVQELVSCSFLQPEECDFYTIHDLLHDLLAKVTGSDCFRIENARSQREVLKGEVPRDARHLSVRNCDGELIAKKILGLENLRTLIIRGVEWDTPAQEKKFIESICNRLLKLRVLDFDLRYPFDSTSDPDKFSVPESVSQLRHLRFLAFSIMMTSTVMLPRALNKLHHIQVLDFGYLKLLEFNFDKLINVRHICCWSTLKLQKVDRLISLQTIPAFTVSKQGYELKQLRDLNKLERSLDISGLENVKSKEEALEANLASKERLTNLTLGWDDDVTRCSPEVEAEVFEGLRPPVGLETLIILGYKGSRYPDWMVGKQNGGPKDLQLLHFEACSQLGPGPQLEAFPHLRSLSLLDCSWDTLPGNMEHLTSLKKLVISRCMNIHSLPTLPQSIEEFCVYHCNDELMKSCQTVGHPCWKKIEHIPKKRFHPARSEEDHNDSDGTAPHDSDESDGIVPQEL